MNNTIEMKLIQDSTYTTISPMPELPAGTKILFKIIAIGDQSDTSVSHRYMYEIRPFKYCNAKGSAGTTSDWAS